MTELSTCECGDAHFCRLRDKINSPAAFWRALTPEQTFALLMAAPKVAGPRVPGSKDDVTVRDALVTNRVTAGVAFVDGDSRGRGETEADNDLRAAGWLLATVIILGCLAHRNLPVTSGSYRGEPQSTPTPEAE